MQHKTNIIVMGIVKTLLVMSPALLGFSIILFSKGPVDDLTFSLGLFLAGFTGVIVAIRKEIPSSLRSVRGKWAVIQGIGFVTVMWGSALYMFLS
jgi:hypothetical protein